MKKMLFVMLGVILAGYAYAQAPGAGTPTAPNALTINVLNDCQKHPGVPYCDSPRFMQMIKEIEAGFSEVSHISCCSDNQPHHRDGEGKGGKKGDEGTSKPKPWCAKLVESEFVDNYGFPKYHYPESTEMMPPCISPAYNPKDGGPCCLVPEGTKAGKGGNRGGKPNPYCSEAALGVPKCTEGITTKCCIVPGSPQDPNAPKGGKKGKNPTKTSKSSK